MQRLNAIDAIGPAWTHTQQLLLAPKNWRLLFKICAVAFFAQAGGCNSSYNNSTSHLGGQHASPMAAAAVASIFLLIGLIALIIGLIFFYINSRLQLVLFEAMASRQTRIGPIWSRYSRIVWRWIGLKLAYFVVALLCCLPILLPVILQFIHATRLSDANGAKDPAAIITTLIGFISAIFFVAIIVSIGYVLLLDFGLPSMALEDASISETLRRIFVFIRQEPGQIALFILMRFLLGFAWGIGGSIAILIGTLIALIPLGGIGFALYAGLQHGGLGAHIVMVGGLVVLGAILLAALIIAFILVFGYCFAFLKAYSLYFLGGRYPLLGNLLEPEPFRPFTPPPPPPSPEERDDEDSGPPLPMNPAVA